MKINMVMVEYKRQAKKVEGVVVWKRVAVRGSSHEEYLLELEGKGVFAVVTAWKGNGYEGWVLMPENKDIKAPRAASKTLRAAVMNAATVRYAMEFAGQEIRYEPNPEKLGMA